MPYSIKDPATDRVIRELPRVKRKPIVEAIREACEHELERERRKVPLYARLRPVLDAIKTAAPTGLVADKAFFDGLSGDE